MDTLMDCQFCGFKYKIHDISIYHAHLRNAHPVEVEKDLAYFPKGTHK